MGLWGTSTSLRHFSRFLCVVFREALFYGEPLDDSRPVLSPVFVGICCTFNVNRQINQKTDLPSGPPHTLWWQQGSDFGEALGTAPGKHRLEGVTGWLSGEGEREKYCTKKYRDKRERGPGSQEVI